MVFSLSGVGPILPPCREVPSYSAFLAARHQMKTVRRMTPLCRHVLTDNAVPKDAFKGAKGVVFLQAAAAAVGLTAFRGQGFIVARVDGSWSAPAFIRLATMGMGLSLGGVLQPCLIVRLYLALLTVLGQLCLLS